MSASCVATLTIDAKGLDCDRLLSDWRWLVPEALRPFSLTMFGDWFFEDSAAGWKVRRRLNNLHVL